MTIFKALILILTFIVSLSSTLAAEDFITNDVSAVLKSFDSNDVGNDFAPLRYTNRARCARDASEPTQTMFLVVDGYNAGKLSNSLAKATGRDADAFTKEGMKVFRQATTFEILKIMKLLIDGDLPLLKVVTDSNKDEIVAKKYSSIVEACKDKEYCEEMDAYIASIWKIVSDDNVVDINQELNKIDNFDYKTDYIHETVDARVNCFYLRNFSPLQGHLYSTKIDKKILDDIAVASLERDYFVASCFDESDQLNSRNAAIQIDLTNLDEKAFKKYGFHFWNSVKTYLAWAWRNDPELSKPLSEFDFVFRSLAFEQSVMLMPNGCKSITPPTCDNEYLAIANLREFAKSEGVEDQWSDSPKGPEDELIKNPTPDVNNDILNLDDNKSASQFVEAFRKHYVNFRGFMGNKYFSSINLLNLINGGITQDQINVELANFIDYTPESNAKKNELYYMCAEYSMAGHPEYSFLKKEIELLSSIDFGNHDSKIAAINIDLYMSYYDSIKNNVLSICDDLHKQKYWNGKDFKFSKKGLNKWYKDAFFGVTYKDEASDLADTDIVITPQKSLVIVKSNQSTEESVICTHASDCARKVLASMMGLYSVATNMPNKLLAQDEILDIPAFNPYAERVACKVYNPWFKTKKAFHTLATDMLNVALFGWNAIPGLVALDLEPGRVVSFNKLVEEGKIKLDPKIEGKKTNLTFGADFGPLLGVPCVVALSNSNVNLGSIYAFSGVSFGVCNQNETHKLTVYSASDVGENGAKERSFCGSCYLNFSTVGSLVSAAGNASPINFAKLGFYLFRTAYRFVKNITDPFDVPKIKIVDIDNVTETYKRYGEVPKRCVRKLGKGLSCLNDTCEDYAKFFFQERFKQHVKSVSIIKGSLNDEYRATIRTKECNGKYVMLFDMRYDKCTRSTFNINNAKIYSKGDCKEVKAR